MNALRSPGPQMDQLRETVEGGSRGVSSKKRSRCKVSSPNRMHTLFNTFRSHTSRGNYGVSPIIPCIAAISPVACEYRLFKASRKLECFCRTVCDFREVAERVPLELCVVSSFASQPNSFKRLPLFICRKAAFRMYRNAASRIRALSDSLLADLTAQQDWLHDKPCRRR